MSNTPTPEQIEEIGSALAAGRKIEAIKIYREATQCDLRAAKEFIEALHARLREEDPERFPPPSNKSGCAAALILGAGFFLTAAVLAVLA